METEEKIAKLRDIEERINCFFYLKKPRIEKILLYKFFSKQLQRTYYDFILGHLEPCEYDEFKKYLDKQGIELRISFPLNGEVGFVTAQNKIIRKTR